MSSGPQQFDDPRRAPRDGAHDDSVLNALVQSLAEIAVPPVWNEAFVLTVLESHEQLQRESFPELQEESIDPLEMARVVEECTRILHEDGSPPRSRHRTIQRILDAHQEVVISDFLKETARDNASTSAEHLNRGNSQASLGCPNQALRDYTQAIELNPTDAIVYFERGKLYLQMGQSKEARHDFEAAVALTDSLLDHHEARLYLAEALCDDGEYATAVTEFRAHLANVSKVADLPRHREEGFTAVKHNGNMLNLDYFSTLLPRWIALVRRLEANVGREEQLRSGVVEVRSKLGI